MPTRDAPTERAQPDAARVIQSVPTTTATQMRGTVVTVLHELLQARRDDEVVALVTKLVARNGELEKKLAEMLSRRKNEGVSTAQLRLFLDALVTASNEELDDANDKLRAASGIDDETDSEPETEVTAPEKRKQPPLRQPPPDNLRRVDNPIAVPPTERPCPKCGKERTCMGHDVTEVIELIPAEVIVRVDRREKLACTECEGELVRAPQGDKVVSGGRLGSTLVATMLVDKYWDGLPLNRTKQRLARLGLPLPMSTLADQVTWSTDLLRPLWQAAAVKVLVSTVMHLDGTSLPVLDKNVPGNKKLGALWGYVGDRETALYLYASTAKKQGQKPGEIGPEDFLARRTGYVVADASSIFDASFKRDALIECGCNMHSRRYFVKALDRGDRRAALPLAAYKKLYEVEAEIRDLAADAKRAERQARSKPIYDELIAWCETYQPHEPPSSPLGAAIRYQLNHALALRRFLDDGVVPLDNGVVERLHVRAALTRKNYLFAGSDAGAERAAIAYTILGCCQLADVNPSEYLGHILPRLARGVRLRDVPAMLPARWKAARDLAAAAVAPAEP
jgi:transposase